MPEVSADAALLVDPLSVDEIANAFEELYIDLTLRNFLIEKEFKQINQFGWDETANKIWQVF